MARKKKNDSIKLTELHKAVLREAEKTIKIRTGEGLDEVSVVEAVVRKVLNTALGGSPHAQRHIMEWFEEAERAEQQKFDNDTKTVERARRHYRVERHLCVEQGEDPESVLPHPDDIVVDKEHGVNIIGPCDAAELRECRRLCDMRDALLLQNALELRLATRKPENEPDVRTPSVIAILLNDRMVRRFRDTDSELTEKIQKFECRSKRELLRDCFRSWQMLNIPLKRGFVFPDIREFEHTFKFISAGLKFLREKQEAGIHVSNIELVKELEWIANQV